MDGKDIAVGILFFTFLFLFDKVFPNFGDGMTEGMRLGVTLAICTAFAAVVGILIR